MYWAESLSRTRSLAGHAAKVACLLATIGAACLRPSQAHAEDAADSLWLYAIPNATMPLAAPKLGGYIQARQVAQEHVGLTAFLNRARFSVDGVLPLRFSYRLLTELEASAGARNPAIVSLREATVKWSPPPFAFTAGEFKTPFSREYLIPVPALELADLATAVDSLAPKYDVGFMGEVALGAFATVAAGVFNGEGANAIANRDSAVMVVGRVTARPISQLAVGASGTRDDRDSLRWGVDAVLQYYGVVVRTEYMTRHVRGRSRGQDDFGWYVLMALRVIPRVQLLVRQEDFQRPAYGASRRVRGASYGTNIDVVPNKVRLLIEFLRRNTGSRQLRGDSFIAQAQVQF